MSHGENLSWLYKMSIFLPLYETLFQIVIKLLLIIYQNIIKMPWKNRKCLVYSYEVTSYINHMQGIWVSLSMELFIVTDNIGLTIRMKIFNNVKHHDTVCLKLGHRVFTSLKMLQLEPKPVSALKLKKTYFYGVASFRNLLSLS